MKLVKLRPPQTRGSRCSAREREKEKSPSAKLGNYQSSILTADFGKHSRALAEVGFDAIVVFPETSDASTEYPSRIKKLSKSTKDKYQW